MLFFYFYLLKWYECTCCQSKGILGLWYTHKSSEGRPTNNATLVTNDRQGGPLLVINGVISTINGRK